MDDPALMHFIHIHNVHKNELSKNSSQLSRYSTTWFEHNGPIFADFGSIGVEARTAPRRSGGTYQK